MQALSALVACAQLKPQLPPDQVKRGAAASGDGGGLMRSPGYVNRGGGGACGATAAAAAAQPGVGPHPSSARRSRLLHYATATFCRVWLLRPRPAPQALLLLRGAWHLLSP